MTVEEHRQPTPGFCRDCLERSLHDEPRCLNCGSPRLIRHEEIEDLSIAHIDCDAFYAAIEKRDRPELADRPVIVGGGTRGVVATACYVARVRGVKSAMPMFKALQLCPDAVVIKPNMQKYQSVAEIVRNLMLEITPLVEPISIDEAFLDLSGTVRLHGMYPALTLAKLLKRITAEVGISASAGLSHNKFLAKLASDLDKPRGFALLGKNQTLRFLAARPVNAIWGVGKITQEQLARDGITTISQLQAMDKSQLMMRYGSMGSRLYHLSRGEDQRLVSTDDQSKSISAETTFDTDIRHLEDLERLLWPLAERVSRRAKSEGVAGHVVILKLKTSDFKTRTRSVSLSDATSLATRIYDAALPLLRREVGKSHFRLMGVGIADLVKADPVSETETLDLTASVRAKAELAIDHIRGKFGSSSVTRGLGFDTED